MGLRDVFRRPPVEARSNETLAALGAHWLGTPTDRYPAEQLGITVACVALISQQLAGLPCRVYRYDEAGVRSEVPGHPLSRMVRRGPSPWQSWNEWVEFTAASTLLFGNSLSELITDRAGRAIGLHPIPWGLVRVEIVAPGRVVYHVTGDGLTAPMGTSRRLLAHQVLHLRARSDDGVIGIPPLRRAAAASAVEVDNHARQMWRHYSQPAGVLTIEKTISPEAAKRLKESFSSLYGGSNRGKVAVLESGLGYTPFNFNSPEDQELVEARKLSITDIARAFGCPEPLANIGENSTFTNSATLLAWFGQSTLAHWARRLEAELSRTVLLDGERENHEVDLDMTGILRGDHEARVASLVSMVQAGILTPDEAREAEGWSPRGDQPAKTDGCMA